MKRTAKIANMLIALLIMPVIVMALPYENEWNRKGARCEIDRGFYNYVSNGIPHTIYRYNYDAAGNVVKETRISLKFGQWFNEGYDRVWTYDSRNNCTSDAQKALDPMGQVYDVWKHEYTYDSRNNMLEDVYYESMNFQLVPKWKEVYTYDANNNMTSYAPYWYNGEDTGWGTTEKTEYTYDAKGNMLTSTHYFGDENERVKDRYNTYTYDGKNLLTSSSMFKIDYQGVVTETERVKYTYDAQGHEIERLETIWAKSNETGEYTWKFSQKYTHAYNAKGLMTYERYYLDETTISGGQKYEYDEQGNMTAITYCAFNQDGSIKEISGVREYYYNEDALYQGKLAQGTCGPEGSEGAITWKIDKDNTLTISGTGSMVDYKENYLEMPWIVSHMFIKKIVVGEGITHIGDNAFRGADKVEEVVLPSTLQTIGQNAFYELTSLKTLNLPDALTSVGSYAFYRCGALQTVAFGNKLESIGNYAFEECDIQSLLFPESLRTINGGAFMYNNNLTYFNIPAGVTSIGSSAFAETPSVRQIDCYALNNPFERGAAYCPKAILYVPEGCKNNYKNSLKDNFLDILEFGESFTPKQYIINGVAYDYTENATDIFGDGSVIVEGTTVKLHKANLKNGLTLNFSNASIEVSGKCFIQGDIHAKDKLRLLGDFYYDGLCALNVSGGVYSDSPGTDNPFEVSIAYFSATLPESAPSATKTRAVNDQQSVIGGFAYITYNSFIHRMYEPEDGYYDSTKLMLIDASGNAASKVVISSEYGMTDIEHIAVENKKEGKFLNNGKVVITRNGKCYNIHGIEIK